MIDRTLCTPLYLKVWEGLRFVILKSGDLPMGKAVCYSRGWGDAIKRRLNICI